MSPVYPAYDLVNSKQANAKHFGDLRLSMSAIGIQGSNLFDLLLRQLGMIVSLAFGMFVQHVNSSESHQCPAGH